MPLETDLFEQHEVYVLRRDTINVSRRKCGGWVHVHKFLGALDEGVHETFLNDLKHRSKILEINSSTTRFGGFWAPLEIARELLQTYNLLSIVGPLLQFDRVASVEYNGVNCWEMFVTVRRDIQIRILRRQDNNWVNMSNIFDFHNLSWNTRSQAASTGIMTVQREFQKKYGKFVLQNDPTLLGGVWTPLDIAREFASSKNLSKKLLPILGFDTDQSPSAVTGHIPLSKEEKFNAENWEWIPDKEYYGYPRTFTIPNLSHKPKLTDLVVTVRIHIPGNRRQKSKTSITVSRRLSDNFVNASNLIKAACALRISELNDRSEKDPYFEISNELYFLQKLNRCKFVETVTHDTKRSLNGKWVPLQFAREVFAEIHLKSLLALKFDLILFDPSIEEPEVDQDEIEIIPELPLVPVKKGEIIELLDDPSQNNHLIKEEPGRKNAQGQYNDSSSEDGDNLIRTTPRRKRRDLDSLFDLSDASNESTDREDEGSSDNGDLIEEYEQLVSKTSQGVDKLAHVKEAPTPLGQPRMTLSEKINYIGKELNIIMHRSIISASETNQLDKLLKMLEDIDNLSVKMISKTNILDSLNKMKSNYQLRQFDGRVGALKNSLVRAKSRAEVSSTATKFKKRIDNEPGINRTLKSKADDSLQYSIRRAESSPESDVPPSRYNNGGHAARQEPLIVASVKEYEVRPKNNSHEKGSNPTRFNDQKIPVEPKRVTQKRERVRETAGTYHGNNSIDYSSHREPLPSRPEKIRKVENNARDTRHIGTDTYINKAATKETKRKSSIPLSKKAVVINVYDLPDFKRFESVLDIDVLQDDLREADYQQEDHSESILNRYKDLTNYDDGLKHHMVHVSRELLADNGDGSWLFDRMALFYNERKRRAQSCPAG